MRTYTYALSDLYSGLYWGSAFAVDAKSAAQVLDEHIGSSDGYQYDDVGRSVPNSGYAVWKLPSDVDAEQWEAEADLTEIIGDPDCYISVGLIAE